jgi:hypothetical protein
MKSAIVLGLCLVMFFSMLVSSQSKTQQATVVVNSLDLPENSAAFDTIQSNGVKVVAVSAFDFPDHQNDSLIIILGGQNAPEGVGALVSTLLDQKEQEELVATPNAMTVRIMPNIWGANQNVLLFAGNEKEQTARVFSDSLPALLKILKSDSPTQIANISSATDHSTQTVQDYSQLRVC